MSLKVNKLNDKRKHLTGIVATPKLFAFNYISFEHDARILDNGKPLEVMLIFHNFEILKFKY